MSEQEKPKGISNEKLPDPEVARTELAGGEPRLRTAAHLKRILAASLAAPLVAGVASCYVVVDPVPPPHVIRQPFGRLAIKSPQSVSLVINGGKAIIPDEVPIPLAGSVAHSIQLSSSNATRFVLEISVVVPAGPAPTGSVSGILKPLSRMEVLIDGVTKGILAGPDDLVELPAGVYTVELVPLPTSSPATFTLEIAPSTVKP